MAYYQPSPNQNPYNAQGNSAQNLQFYPSTYSNQPVSGHSTPFQAQGYGNQQSYGQGGSNFGGPSMGFGGASAGFGGVSGRMGEQGGLRTGWLAAFGTEGYEGEPPLLEELGVNFGHIKMKVGLHEAGEDEHQDVVPGKCANTWHDRRSQYLILLRG